MGIILSLIAIAVGAILRWAVTAEVDGLDIQTLGLIVMIVGLVGLLLSLVWWSSWLPWSRERDGRTVRIVDTPPR
jgi:hypothetical protein